VAAVGHVIDVSWFDVTIGARHRDASDRSFCSGAEKGQQIFT
jgi:hypothetical protein